MRRLSTVCGVSLLLALASSPAALADPSWAKVSAELKETGYTNASNLAVSWSQSDASVSDSLLNSDWFSMWGVMSDTTASAVIATASGHAETESFYAFAESIATPPPDVESCSGWNRAYQEWTFQATAAGTVRFDFAVSYTIDLQTALPGEKASGGFSATLVLCGGGGSVGMNPFTVQDGADNLAEGSSPMVIQRDFAAGETGWMAMEVKTYGSANTVTVVPAPAAVLLGVLGLGAAGVKLRKHA